MEVLRCAAVHLQVFLELDYQTIGDIGTDERVQFEASFTQSLSFAIGIAVGRFHILGIEAGSAVITVQVFPHNYMDPGSTDTAVAITAWSTEVSA
jgi:hypothetical protein